MGRIIVKHLGNLSDRETVTQIEENPYIQYFLGYTSFTNKSPFSPSLFVEFRKRLTEEIMCEINDIICLYAIKSEHDNVVEGIPAKDSGVPSQTASSIQKEGSSSKATSESKTDLSAAKDEDIISDNNYVNNKEDSHEGGADKVTSEQFKCNEEEKNKGKLLMDFNSG